MIWQCGWDQAYSIPFQALQSIASGASLDLDHLGWFEQALRLNQKQEQTRQSKLQKQK